MSSLPPQLRPISTFAKIAMAVGGAAPVVLGMAMWLQTRASHADVATAVEQRAQRAEQVARDAIAAHAFADEQERRAQRSLDEGVLERLVSLEAADLEGDKRRKADAAAYARNAYREAVERGVPPAKAAQQAVDSRPPWRR